MSLTAATPELTRYARKRAAGICAFCPAPSITGRALCPVCRERNRVALAARYADRRSRQVCVWCESPSATVRCDDCVEAQAVTRAARRPA